VQIGGGAFSGKDYTKVDRSGAYFARWIAKNIVAAKLADKCLVQISWCIGKKTPIAFDIDFLNTNKINDKEIIKAVNKIFKISVYDIIKCLNLTKPNYQQTACFGHFGRAEFNWEKTNMVSQLKKYLKLK
jgi:S-adenosylmethionine synthetase